MDAIDEAIKGKRVLSAPCFLSAGAREAMIVDDGCPVELIKFVRNG